MDYSDILQDISVDLSFMVKKHLKNIKKLDSKQQKQFGKLFGDMKQGIEHWKIQGLNFSKIFHQPDMGTEVSRYNVEQQYHGLDKALDLEIIKKAKLSIEKKEQVVLVENFGKRNYFFIFYKKFFVVIKVAKIYIGFFCWIKKIIFRTPRSLVGRRQIFLR